MTEEKIEGIKLACEMIDDMYAKAQTHKYMIGDCILAKFNLLKKEKVRKNPNFKNKLK